METVQPPVTEQDRTSDRRNASITPQPDPQPIVSQGPPTPTQARISHSRTSQRSMVQQTGQPTAESPEKTQPLVTEGSGTSDVRNVSPVPQPGVSAAPQTPTNSQGRIPHSRTRQRTREQQSGRPMAASSETTQPSLRIDQVATLEINTASSTLQPKVSQQTQYPTNPQVRISQTKRKSRMRGQVSLNDPEHQRLLSRILQNPPVTVAAPQLESLGQSLSPVATQPAAQTYSLPYHTPAPRVQAQQQLQPTIGQRNSSIPPTSMQLTASPIHSSASVEPASQIYPHLGHTPAPQAQGPQQIPPAVTRGQSDSIPTPSLQQSAPQINPSVSMEPAAQMQSSLHPTPTPHVQVQQNLQSAPGGQSYTIPPTSPRQSAREINRSVTREPAAQTNSSLHHTPIPQVQVQQHLPSATGGQSYSIPPTSQLQNASQIQSSVLMKPAATKHPQHSQIPASQLQVQQQVPPKTGRRPRGRRYSISPTSLRQTAPQISSSVSTEPAAQMHSSLHHTPTPQVQVPQHLPSATSGQSYSISPTSLHQNVPQMHSSVSTERAAPQMYPLLYQTPSPQIQAQQQFPPLMTSGQGYSLPSTRPHQSAPQMNSSVSMELPAHINRYLYHTPAPQVQVQQNRPSATGGQSYSISPTSLHQNVPQMHSSVSTERAAPQMYPLLYQTPSPQLQAQQQFPPFMSRGQGYSLPSSRPHQSAPQINSTVSMELPAHMHPYLYYTPAPQEQLQQVPPKTGQRPRVRRYSISPTSLRQTAPQINSSVSMEPAAQVHSSLHHTPTPQVQVPQHLPSATSGQSYSISPTSLHQNVPQMHSSVSTERAAPQMYPLLYQTPSPQIQAQQQFPPLMTSGQGYSLPSTRPHQSAPQMNSSVSMELPAHINRYLYHTPAPQVQVQQNRPSATGGQSYSISPTSLHQNIPQINSSVSMELPAHRHPCLYHTPRAQVQVQQQLPRMTGGQSSSIPPTRLQHSITQIQSSVSIEPAAPQTYTNLYHTPAPQVQAQPQLPPMIGGESYSIPDRSSVGGTLRDVTFSEMLAQLATPVGPLGRISSQINGDPDDFVYARNRLKSEIEKEESSYTADVKELLTQLTREEEELRRKYEAIERERASKLIADFSASEQLNAAPGLTQCHNRAEATCGSGQAGSSSRRVAQSAGRRNPYSSPQRNVVGINVGSGPYRELSSTGVNVSSGPVVPHLAAPFPTNLPSAGHVSSHEPSLPASASFSKGSGPSPIDSVVWSSMRSPLNAPLENLSSHHNNLDPVSDFTSSTAPATSITTADVAPIVTGAVVSVGPCSFSTYVSPPDSPPREI